MQNIYWFNARFLAFRNATQEFFRNKKVLRAFLKQPQMPQRRLRLLAALRKQIETTSIFFRNSNLTIHSCDYV